jgi:hypothetical protein
MPRAPLLKDPVVVPMAEKLRFGVAKMKAIITPIHPQVVEGTPPRRLSTQGASAIVADGIIPPISMTRLRSRRPGRTRRRTAGHAPRKLAWV